MRNSCEKTWQTGLMTTHLRAYLKNSLEEVDLDLESKEVEAIANPWINTPIDFNKVKKKIDRLTVFLSSNEPYGYVEDNKKIFKEKLDAKIIILKNKGHFTEDDGISEFPELLKEILNK